MFSLNNQLEIRRMTISSLVTCIYLPSIVTVICYQGLLYSVGKGSSFYILALIFVAELLKSFYLSASNDVHGKRPKQSKNRASDIIKSFVFLLGVLFSFFIGIILFGAPALDCHEETLMLSTLLTLLTAFPLVLHCGVESSVQLMFGVKSYSKDTIVEMLINNAIMTVFGAWMGAVVIPLDWNTPWQQWPIPCYLGALGVYVLANVMAVFNITFMAAAHKYPVLNSVFTFLNGYSARMSK